MEQLTKSVMVTDIKLDDDTGKVSAVFATMGVIDKDQDVTLPGFFGTQDVAILRAHDRSHLVGKGRITEDGDSAVLAGQFFIETDDGKQEYLKVKAMGGLQEWSYGFNILDGGSKLGQHDGQNVRFLTPLDSGDPGVKVAEVSTVILGAGENTRTVGIKTEGLRFVEQAEQVAQAVELLYGRADEIRTLRADKGADLGDEAVARLLEVKTRLATAAEMFGSLIEPTPAPIEDTNHDVAMIAARRHLAAAQAMTSGR